MATATPHSERAPSGDVQRPDPDVQLGAAHGFAMDGMRAFNSLIASQDYQYSSNAWISYIDGLNLDEPNEPRFQTRIRLVDSVRCINRPTTWHVTLAHEVSHHFADYNQHFFREVDPLVCRSTDLAKQIKSFISKTESDQAVTKAELLSLTNMVRSYNYEATLSWLRTDIASTDGEVNDATFVASDGGHRWAAFRNVYDFSRRELQSALTNWAVVIDARATTSDIEAVLARDLLGVLGEMVAGITETAARLESRANRPSAVKNLRTTRDLVFSFEFLVGNPPPFDVVLDCDRCWHLRVDIHDCGRLLYAALRRRGIRESGAYRREPPVQATYRSGRTMDHAAARGSFRN